MKKYSKAWWADTADRVISTIAQTAVGTLTVGAIPGLLNIDLVSVLSVSGLAGVLSFLKAVALTKSDPAPVTVTNNFAAPVQGGDV